jgi:hypothetical protein
MERRLSWHNEKKGPQRVDEQLFASPDTSTGCTASFGKPTTVPASEVVKLIRLDVMSGRLIRPSRYAVEIASCWMALLVWEEGG